MKKGIIYIFPGLLFGSALLSGLVLASLKVSADTVDTINVIVPESCTLTTPAGSGQVYTLNMMNSQYKNDIGKTRISVFCNNDDTFAIYAIGYSGDTFGNTEMITTATGATNIATGTATSGATSNWAMKLETVTGTGGAYTPSIVSPFNNFTAVPSSYTKVAEVASTTGQFSEAAIDASYAVFMSATQAPGTYTGKVRYTVVHPATAAAPVAGITLSEAYAKAGKQKVNGYYTLQDMNTTICDTATIVDEPSQMQAIDTRDNKVYWITKLQDGKCWMTQNLDLNLSDSIALTDADTDLNTVSSWTPVRSTINAVTDANTSGSISGWANNNNSPYSVDLGDYYWKNSPFYDSSLCYPNSNYQYCSYLVKGTTGAGWSTYFATTPYSTNGTHGHVGNKYNWSAAVASNDTNGYTASTYNNINNNPQNSICPKGWRLPTISGQTPTYDTNGSPNEFARLAYLYDNYTGNMNISSEGLEKAPLYFTRSGGVDSGILYHAGYIEHYWSSSVISSTYAYILGVDSGAVGPEDYSYRAYGFSVRCLAR